MRDAASESAQAVANVLPEQTFQDQYAEMVARLATNEWFTARISSAALIAAAYTRLKEDQQKEFLSHFCGLCRDDTPMVRRVASQHLGNMLETVIQVAGRSCLEPDGTVTTLLIPLYEDLASNEQPVRAAREIHLSHDCTFTFSRMLVGNRTRCDCKPRETASPLERVSMR